MALGRSPAMPTLAAECQQLRWAHSKEGEVAACDQRAGSEGTKHGSRLERSSGGQFPLLSAMYEALGNWENTLDGEK